MPTVKDLSVVLCGEAGQGIQTVENILTKALKLSGYHVFATKEYMSRVRGGTNSTSIRVSGQPVAAYCRRIDILIPLDPGRTPHLQDRIDANTIILAEQENVPEECKENDCRIINVPYSQKALELGNKIYTNVVAVGVVAGLLSADPEIINNLLQQYFSTKEKTVIDDNLKAAQIGFEIGQQLTAQGKIAIPIEKDPAAASNLVLSGAEAVGLGALAGGCNFISAYPMTPSTSTFTFLAQKAAQFEIVSEQAEDEIAAMNMALGAWYAGARALVTTSGGGYDLMQEGMSLAGMLEMPLVVNIAQRPGPATGLPTRTEQGDFNLALYSGHGEFPRIIIAPGSIEEAVPLIASAFDLADKYQLPVFFLTDQYFVDSYYDFPEMDLSQIKVVHHFVWSAEGYKRYQLTANGISPRAIPGNGEGLVVADSDEHDEAGHITENLEMRNWMVEQRNKKIVAAQKDEILPELIGPDNFEVLVVGWGSNRNIVVEALARQERPNMAFLHFKQLFPLPEAGVQYLKRAKKLVMIENNFSSQFGNLIEHVTGLKFSHKILKYNGLPFSVEEVMENLKNV